MTGPVPAHELVVFPVVRHAQHRAAREAGRIRPTAAAELERELRARVREQARLIALAELLARRARMQLREVLRDHPHRELNRPANARCARAPAACWSDDPVQADERHDADDREDRDRDQQLDQREAAARAPSSASLRRPPPPRGGADHCGGRKPGRRRGLDQRRDFVHDALGIVGRAHRNVDAMQIRDGRFRHHDVAAPLPARELDVFVVVADRRPASARR